MEKAYFINVKLNDGRWVNLVYESAHRKNTTDNHWDLHVALRDWNIANNADINFDWQSYVRSAGMYRGKRRYVNCISDHIYIMNSKNMYEMCFEDYETIDLRKGQA